MHVGRITLAVALAFMVVVVGCGGGGGGTGLTNTSGTVTGSTGSTNTGGTTATSGTSTSGTTSTGTSSGTSSSGSSGGGGQTAAPVVPIAWPARSRNVNAPSSALSLAIVFHRTDATGNDLSLSANRDSNLTAHVSSYTAATAIPISGTYNMTVSFYANPNETGTVVGTAAASIKVNANGNLLNSSGGTIGDLNFTGVVRSVSVPAQTVNVGQQVSIVASALDANGNVVVITPGSFIYTVSSGQSFATITQAGLATGVAAGAATVSAAVDGVSGSNTLTVSVPPPTVITENLETTDLCYDAGRGVIYATTTATAPSFPNSVVPIDPATGKFGTPISVGTTPNFLCLSGDGGHLYVGCVNGTVKRFVMPAGTLDSTITLPAGLFPALLINIPGTADSWIVALQGSGNAEAQSIVFDGGTARTATAVMGQYITINGAGTRLYGYQRFSNSGSLYYTADINSTGLVNVTSNVTAIQGFGNRIHYINGIILADDGTEVSPDSASLIRTLSFTTIDHVAGVVKDTNRVYYASWDPKQLQSYDITTAAALSSVPINTGISGGLETCTSTGTGRVIFRSFSGSPNTVTLVTGLN